MSAHISPLARFFHSLPSPACGRGAGGEGAFALSTPDSKRFRAPAGARVTFLLRGQEKSNQKRRPPRLALAGHPARQVREAGPGFSSGHRATAPALPQLGHPCPRLPARKGESIHGLARCAAWSSPPHRRPGALQEQARFLRARSNGNSRSKTLCSRSLPPLRAGESWNGVLLLLPLLLRAGARCSTRAPYGAAGGARKVRRMAGRDAGQFSAGTRRCRRKTPQPARAPGRQDAWRARHRGAVSLWLLSLWASKEKVARLPAGRRNRFETCDSTTRKAPLPHPSPASGRGEKSYLTPTLSLDGEAVEGEGAGAQP